MIRALNHSLYRSGKRMYPRLKKKALTFYSQSLILPWQCLGFIKVLSYCLIKPRHIPWQYFCLNFVWIFTLSFLKIPVLSKALQSRSHDIFFGKSFLFHRPYLSQGKLHSHFFLCLSILPLRQHFAKYIRHFHIFR